MKKSMIPLLFVAALMVVGLSACEKAADTRTVQNAQPAQQAESQPAAAASAEYTGKVIETMDAGGYTYVHLDDGAEKVWAAGPVTPIEVGQEIHISKNMAMTDFHSKAMDKTFEVIYFVGTFAGHAEGEGHGGGMESMSGMGGMGSGGDPHGGMNMSTMGGSSHNTVEMTEVASVDKADFAVAEIFAGSADLGGKTVKVRGQVVKFTPNIMGTNWIHVQDGTGDLTVTSSAVVAVGDIVLVEGTLTVNKDFGAGYKYDAIIEGATVTKE